MTLPGETLHSGAPDTCPDCRVTVDILVHDSYAGYYIGCWCACGPYTRESVEYYRNRAEAECALLLNTWTPRR